MELLSIRESADLIRVKESTFRTWINRKQIPDSVVFRIGNTVRIIKPKFENWIENVNWDFREEEDPDYDPDSDVGGHDYDRDI